MTKVWKPAHLNSTCEVIMLEKDHPLPKKFTYLSGVDVAYTDIGEGEPILFVHGIPTSSFLWRNVIRALEKDFRCIAPDLMGLGDTQTPPDYSYDMKTQGKKIIELADYLKLEKFTLICHDQGGACAQYMAVNNQERIRRFILTNCVCYDNWPVPLVTFFMNLMKMPLLYKALYRFNIAKAWGKSPIGMRLGVYNNKAMSNDAIDEYLKFSEDYDKLLQFNSFLLAGDPLYSIEAAKKFNVFVPPTYIIWAENDRWLDLTWANRLYRDIKGAKKLVTIPGAGHFFQEEKPEICANYIKTFMNYGD